MRDRMDRYGERDAFDSKVTKAYNFPLYLLRKTNYYTVHALLKLASGICKVWGFHLDYTLDDEDAWKWYLRAKIPWITVNVEKK